MGEVRVRKLGRVWAYIYIVLAVVGSISPVMAGTADSATTRPTAPLKLTTSPLPIDLETTPGNTVSTDVKVKQSGGDTEQMKVTLMKFGAYGDTGKPQLSDRGPGDDYFDWVKFDKPTFTAPNDVWQTVHMTINVPKSGAYSYYYAVVFSRVGDELKAQPGKAGIAGGTAVLVLLNVNVPGAKRSLELASFGVKHRVVEFLPTTFELKLVNTGNVYVKPGGNIFVSQGNKQVGVATVNDVEGSVLNNSSRVFESDWNDGFPYYEVAKSDGQAKVDRHNKPIMNLNWSAQQPKPQNQILSESDKFISTEGTNPLARIRFGMYTAHLVGIYRDGFGRDIPIESTVNFWVIPWRFLLALLVVLLLVGFGVYSIVRSATWRSRAKRRLGRKH